MTTREHVMAELIITMANSADDERLYRRLNDCNVRLVRMDGSTETANAAPVVKADSQYRDAARRLYAEHSDDAIEVDDDATIAHGEGGAFVAAWLWVADTDAIAERAGDEQDDDEHHGLKGSANDVI